MTLAPLPVEHASQCGPQLTALIAYLTVVCRMPRLVVQRFLEGALQIPISLGSTQKAWEDTSAAVPAPYAALEAALAHEAVVNADETGHRTNGEKRWLWTFVAHTFVRYRIAASRGSDVLQTVLGETFAGVLGTIAPSVGSRGDSYDSSNRSLASSKRRVIQRKGPWRTLEAVEFATLTWVDWFNTRRLLSPIGYVPPAEYEAHYYNELATRGDARRQLNPDHELDATADERLQDVLRPLDNDVRITERTASNSL
jgi:transposase InsO family protein